MNLFTKEVIHAKFDDFDALTEALRGWNLELYKIEKSPFSGEIFQLVYPSFILSCARFNSRLKQTGVPPPAYVLS